MRTNNFIAYDYIKLNPKDSYCTMIIDSYKSFGWEVDVNNKDDKIVVLKRNMKVVNKTELTRLQRNFDSCLDEIHELNKSKQSTATIYSLIIGLIGTVFMALSVFAVTSSPARIVLCVVFGIPAIICWILPIFIYKATYKKREAVVSPIIEKKYDEIYEICSKGYKVLHE